jgi:hypothetical protein
LAGIADTQTARRFHKTFLFQLREVVFSPESFHADRQSTCALGRHVCLEELVQVTVVQVLHYNAEGLLMATHSQHSSDIHVFQSSQDPHIAMEIQPENMQTSTYEDLFGSIPLLTSV